MTDGSRATRGSTIRLISTAPIATSTAWLTNGSAMPSANSAAPIGGPTSWLIVTSPAWSRELATARSSRRTSIGSRVWAALSANTSAVESTKSAASTTAIDTVSVTIETAMTTRIAERSRSTVMTIARRSRRSESAPA